jgi:hypothetical protein
MANWKVSPLYKKSCEEHELYTKDGQTIRRQTGYRGASFYVETTNDKLPEFEFDFVPGGDESKDSIDMYNCCVNNIENVELDTMWDGCWQEIEYPDDMEEDERARLEELIEESGDVYQVLEHDEGWSQTDTEAWIWGPIQIENSVGEVVRVICADDEGNVIDFIEDRHDDTESNSPNENSDNNAWPFPKI